MNDEGGEQTQAKSSDYCLDDSNIPKPTRIRRSIQDDTRLSRVPIGLQLEFSTLGRHYSLGFIFGFLVRSL